MVIILSTDSAVLKIQSKSAGCSLKISRYRQFLMIKQKEDKLIIEVDLELKDDANEKIITTMSVPSKSSGFIQRVRIDALFPLIFQDGEDIAYSEDLKLVNVSAKINEYSLNITVNIGSDITKPSMTMIHSGTIHVESRLVSVSKERLAIASDYFTTLFYGNYKENESEIKTIKKVSEDSFVRFMNMMHSRKFEISTVEQGIITLGFADYFLMPEIAAKIVPFLLSNKLPEDLLSEGLAMADKLPNNSEILEWVLKNIPSNEQLIQVLHDSVPNISPDTTQYCLRKFQERQPIAIDNSTEAKPPQHCFPDLASLVASLAYNQVGVYLQHCNQSGTAVIDEKFFAIPISRPSSSTIRIALDDIWTHVPSAVNSVRCYEGSGETFTVGVRGQTHDVGDCKIKGFFYYL